VVAGDRVLVVDRVEQPLVGDEQQRHAGRLVDAARLRLDDPVLDLVGHAEAVPTADGVRLADQGHRVGELAAADRDRSTGDEADRDVLGLDRHEGSQNFTPMSGSTVSRETSRCSSVLASWVAPQMLASVEYAFSCESR
jgi:hypothetical protein